MGSSQYLYNAKMREEIAEQLGVTPTPGGLEILLRQSENNRMAHGGIVHLADGGPLINPYENQLLLSLRLLSYDLKYEHKHQ